MKLNTPPPRPPTLFQFVLTEMYYDGFHRSFCDDDDDLNVIQESDSIFAFETPETFKLENLRTKRGANPLFFFFLFFVPQIPVLLSQGVIIS